MTRPVFDLLCIVGVPALVAAIVFAGGWLSNRKRALLSGPEPSEHFEGEP